jgi:uncharacterized membrane protein (DUF373 family)
MLERLTLYFQSFPIVVQVTILSVLSLLFVVQALKRYEDQTFIAFALALAALVLAWIRFAKAYWALP